ncbi:MAG: hypothetical protein JRE57_00175 [Deltaproteobacteria bacterium]|nr:hypothetical protein [Deltaproteobacteria bacterium]
MLSRHSRGATVRLFMDIISAGAGVISQSPTMALQRVADSKWFQASDGTWQTAVVENPTVQTDSVNLPGRYHFDFAQSLDVLAASTKYIVKKTNTGSPAAQEYEDLIFGPLAGSASLELCSVQGTIYDGQGDPAANTLVRATLQPVFTDTLGRVVQSDRIVATYTNELGDFDLPLVRGAIFALDIADVGYTRKVTIPDQAQVLFTDL